MLKPTANAATPLAKLKLYCDRAITRAIDANLKAIAAAYALPAERLTVLKASHLPQPYEELKARGDRAITRANELRLQARVTSRVSQELRDRLYANHAYEP